MSGASVSSNESAPSGFSGEPEVTPELAARHGLSPDEFEHAQRVLGRLPTFTELGILSALWSEHCSYKSSKPHLKKFPTQSPRVLQGPGENAGIVEIGEGLAAVFKMESHNHPSFIEPCQGAATGVGGILRDVFTMGARPVALLNSLRFGELSQARNRYLLKEVVAGIAGYGNSIGVSTVGGEVGIDSCYNGNCLVNVFCLGVARTDRIFRGVADGLGNPVVYVGARTGRDGIHGAAMASESFEEESSEKRPAVQVGDPFMEKLLLEACLELMETDSIVAIQDMGAAGLTSSSAEMAARGEVGIKIEMARVPRREDRMNPYEVMLSESQERMLLILRPEGLPKASEIFQKWDLEFAVVGEVTEKNRLQVVDNGLCVADLPISLLVDEVPQPVRLVTPPKASRFASIGSDAKSTLGPNLNLDEAWAGVLAHPDIASKHLVFRQYDHMVRTDTVLRPGGDAAVVRVKGTDKGLALTVDGNSRYCALNPRVGGRIAVMEAARNLSCVGAEPIGLTDCLNFGNPERPEVMWQFAEVIEGMSEACRKIGVPVVSGNVSFYNETEGENIHPTPTVGMVGLVENGSNICPTAFQREGDLIVLLGEPGRYEEESALGGSVYLWHVLGRKLGPCPEVHLNAEAALQSLCRRAVAKRLLSSCHDISDGGLAVALAESGSLANPPLGAQVEIPWTGNPEAILFGEAQGRVVISIPRRNLSLLVELAREADVPVYHLGHVQKENFLNPSVEKLRRAWQEGLEAALNPD